MINLNILTIRIIGGARKLLYFIGGARSRSPFTYHFWLLCWLYTNPWVYKPVNRAHDKVVKMDAAPETNDFNEPDTPKGTKDRVKRGERIHLQYLN